MLPICNLLKHILKKENHFTQTWFCLFCFIFSTVFHWILWMDRLWLFRYCVLLRKEARLMMNMDLFNYFSITKQYITIISIKTFSKMPINWKPPWRKMDSTSNTRNWIYHMNSIKSQKYHWYCVLFCCTKNFLPPYTPLVNTIVPWELRAHQEKCYKFVTCFMHYNVTSAHPIYSNFSST